jgi:hypothetical protein
MTTNQIPPGTLKTTFGAKGKTIPAELPSKLCEEFHLNACLPCVNVTLSVIVPMLNECELIAQVCIFDELNGYLAFSQT